MTSDVEMRLVGPGDERFLDDAWELKERVRREEGVLGQSRNYFAYEYRRSTVYLLAPATDPADARAFGVVDADGYLSLLAVDPDHRRAALGTRLLEAVTDDYESVTCHARTDNDAAVAFYEALGFDVERRIESYYPDGGDAYRLRLPTARSRS